MRVPKSSSLRGGTAMNACSMLHRHNTDQQLLNKIDGSKDAGIGHRNGLQHQS